MTVSVSQALTWGMAATTAVLWTSAVLTQQPSATSTSAPTICMLGWTWRWRKRTMLPVLLRTKVEDKRIPNVIKDLKTVQIGFYAASSPLKD